MEAKSVVNDGEASRCMTPTSASLGPPDPTRKTAVFRSTECADVGRPRSVRPDRTRRLFRRCGEFGTERSVHRRTSFCFRRCRMDTSYPHFVFFVAAFAVGCSSSSDSGGGGATDSGVASDSAIQDSGSTDTASTTDSGGGVDTADTPPAKCDPAGATACVGCAGDSCGTGKECCGSGSTRACAAGCEAGVAEACDGPEDCPGGGQCCVVADVKFSGDSTATATCGSACDVENASTG